MYSVKILFKNKRVIFGIFKFWKKRFRHCGLKHLGIASLGRSLYFRGKNEIKVYLCKIRIN